MSEGKGGHKRGHTLNRAFSKLKCTGGRAVEVDDTAHKPKITHNQSHKETSKGTRAPSAHRTTTYFSDDHRVHHERNQDNGHRHATSPAGPNSGSRVGWPLQTIPVSATYGHVCCLRINMCLTAQFLEQYMCAILSRIRSHVMFIKVVHADGSFAVELPLSQPSKES